MENQIAVYHVHFKKLLARTIFAISMHFLNERIACFSVYYR